MGRKKEPAGFAMGLLIPAWVLFTSPKWHPTIYCYHFTIAAYQQTNSRIFNFALSTFHYKVVV